jgi:hypothetical protein
MFIGPATATAIRTSENDGTSSLLTLVKAEHFCKTSHGSFCRGEVVATMHGVFKSNVESRRLFRPLTSVIVAYALAIQSLLIAVGGFYPLAQASQDAPAFALCLHDTTGAPAAPENKPDFSGCTHCIFCFAGAHHAVIGAAPAFFGRVQVAAVTVAWLGHERSVAPHFRYIIANPRGPPVVA